MLLRFLLLLLLLLRLHLLLLRLLRSLLVLLRLLHLLLLLLQLLILPSVAVPGPATVSEVTRPISGLLVWRNEVEG